MNCRKLVGQAIKRWREINKTRWDKSIGNPRKRHSQFAKEARSDLEFLCQAGANPYVLLLIVDTELWWWDAYNVRDAELSEKARKKFSAPTYWRSCVGKLRKARAPLVVLTRYAWVQFAAASEGSKTPFKRISRNVVAASRAIKGLVNTIEEMKLNEPGWELVQEGDRNMPELRRTAKTARQLGGRSRAAGWGRCAAILHSYLRLTARKPHWVSIVRLLKAAGTVGFAYEVARERKGRAGQTTPASNAPPDTYVDTVRNRVRRLRRSPAMRAEIDELARGHNMRFGGDGMK
jgi:hypothetical protein